MKNLAAVMVMCLMFTGIMFVHAQTLDDYRKEVYIAHGDTLPYRILLPQNFNPAKKYPLLLVLHGSGERGDNNEAQLTHGGRLFIKPEVRAQFPAIIVFPQCSKDSFWSNAEITRSTVKGVPTVFNFTGNKTPTKSMRALLGLLSDLTKRPDVNKKQIYLGGLSMGGMGTFELLWRKPKVFAAAFPICGGGKPETARKYAKKVPLWVFHGAKDDVVLPKYSDIMVQAVKQAGGQPKFTVYPEANHNSWDNAFAEPELLPWLFSHHK